MELRLPNKWTPRVSQREAWAYLAGGGTRLSVCAHRRWGKDDLSLHHTACASQERVGGYWHLLPEYAQARKAIWDAVNPHTGIRRIDEAFPEVLREVTKEQEMFIRFKNGSTWQLAGSDNYNSLVGSSPCGLVFSEYAIANPAAWAYLRPILRENHGWAIFISTPRGRNHFYQLHQSAMADPGWFAQTLPNAVTHIFTGDEMDRELQELQAEHGDTYGKSLFLQEYECSFDAAIPGSFWADSLDALQARGAIVDFAHDRQRQVFTVGDLGRTDDTAIWWYQIEGDQLDIVDFWSGSGYEIYEPSHPDRSIVHVLMRKAKEHGYRYAQHWWPHDARPRRLGMGGKSILQQFQEAGKIERVLGSFAIVPRLDIEEGIQAGRKTFQHVRRFHATRCAVGLEALRHYHREWDPEKHMFLDHPVHDFASHPSDGWRYLSLSWRPSKTLFPEPRETPVQAGLGTWGQIVSKHFADRKAQREEWGLT